MDVTGEIKSLLVSEVMVEVPPDRMGESDNLQDILGVDSLGFVELRVACEERFDIEIGEDDFSPENFRTLGGVASLVERLVREKAGSAS